MTIADFTLTRQLTYRNGAPASKTRRLYAIYKLGSTVFAGAGHYENATRDRLHNQGSWYGYPEANVVVPKSTVSRASFPALAGTPARPRRCRSRSAASTAPSTPRAPSPPAAGSRT